MSTTTGVRLLSRASQAIAKHHYAPIRIPQLQQQPRNPHTVGLRKPFPSPSPTSRIASQTRFHSTSPPQKSEQERQRPLTDRPSSPTNSQASEIAARKAEQPSYQLTFTCKKCSERSSHHVTKQAYHQGTTLITCPGCKNRHLISDHLGIFGDKGVTLEDIMREKGQLLKKGRLGEDGDVEFYSDQEETHEASSGREGEKT